MLPDLKLLYKVISWHQTQRDHKPGESVGIFVTIPSNLAKQFPDDGKEEEDSSPPHITVLFVGDMPLQLEDKLKKTVKSVCDQFKPFVAKIAKPRKFVNDKNQTIIHSPIKSKKLHKFHDELKKQLLKNQIPVDSKFPEYKPHITIEYIEKGENPKYDDIVPEGEWQIDSVWIWGLSEPFWMTLK